jgi:zinc D-Ala-D-Ala carboxypeptidase
MFTPLVPIVIDSIYNNGGPLPKRMAHCTPDMFAAIFATKAEVKVGGKNDVILSDLFRSYDMQFQANLDFVTGKKKAFSPPPGGSMHEAGRAFDLDLDKIKKLTLKKFWPVAKAHGLSPIINKPDTGLSEAWHFDCRGSHDLVHQYYTAKKGDNFKSAYTAMAASAIVSVGQKVDALGEDVRPAYIQSGLIRLGQSIGDLDGGIGTKTRKGLENLSIDPALSLDALVDAIGHELQEKFPEEFFVPGPVIDHGPVPSHIVS